MTLPVSHHGDPAEVAHWLVLVDSLPIGIPATDWDLQRGTSHRRLQAVIVHGPWHVARDLAYSWCAGRWPEHSWDAALWTAHGVETHPEALVLDAEEAIAWTACLVALDAASGGSFCAAELNPPRP